MAVTEITLIDGVQPADALANSQYTAPSNGGGTRITAFTASLVTGTETYRVFIGTSAATAKEIIPATRITGPNHDVPLGLIGQLIPAGSDLFVQSSTGSTISYRATGIEF